MENKVIENVVEQTTESSSENSAAMQDLILSIQSKLNTENGVSNNSEQMVQEKELTKEGIHPIDQGTTANNFDISKIASLLGNPAISNLIGNLGNSGNTENTTQNKDQTSGFNLGDIDPSLIFKFQKMLSSMNRVNPEKNLLLSLKPFLRKSRQDKIGEYITMLTIVNALGIFGSKGSDDDVS